MPFCIFAQVLEKTAGKTEKTTEENNEEEAIYEDEEELEEVSIKVLIKYILDCNVQNQSQIKFLFENIISIQPGVC